MTQARNMFAFLILGALAACGNPLPQGPNAGTSNASPTGVSITILRPEDFQGGLGSVSLERLMPDETVAVIPINAEQILNPDGFSYSLEVSGVAPTGPHMGSTGSRITPQSQLVSRGGSQNASDLEGPKQHGWFAQTQDQLEMDVQKVQAAGVPSLFQASKRIRPQSETYKKCAAPYEIGKTCKYWIFNPDTVDLTEQTQITATLRHISPNAYWFVQNEDISGLSDNDLSILAQKYERELLPSNRRYFGNPQDVDGNGRLNIVISSIVGKYAYGYVSYLDFFSDESMLANVGKHSNEGDIFYAASPNSMPWIAKNRFINIDLPGTLVHELKHLIGGGIRIANERPLEPEWIEEPAAVAAEELAGYGSQVSDYARVQSAGGLGRPQDLRIVYSADDALEGSNERANIYGYNFLFLWRIAERVGHDRFWNTWQNGSDVSVANLERASGMSMPEMMLDFAQTLLFDHTGLKTSADYKSLNLRDGGWSALGYRSLETTRDTARSMAFYLGSGQGRDATIRLSTQHHRPYLIVVRFKGNGSL